MARQYYSLVAGLRELTLDGDHKGFSARDAAMQIGEDLSKKDRARMRLLYNYYDIENIINMRNGRSRFSDLGVFTPDRLAEELKNPVALPAYIARVIAAFDNPGDPDYDAVDTSGRFEHALYEAYYRECARSGSRFLGRWAEFDRNLRNVIAAYTARRRSVPVQEAVVGNDYIADRLKRNSALDFGLKGELDYIDAVIVAVSDEQDLLEKERRIDRIRWETADGLTEFDYFNMDKILAYLVKANIVHRWMSLDEKEGREMLRRLIASMDAGSLIEAAEGRAD